MNKETAKVHSLLQNELGVALPLHISLSRPLTLKTAQKEEFLDLLKRSLNDNGAKALHANPKDLMWHSNETSTRWFLVTRMQASQSLSHLLDVCNGVAKEFQQPLLYADHTSDDMQDKLHISIAWALELPLVAESGPKSGSSSVVQARRSIPDASLEQLRNLQIVFGELKVRIGQDVHVLPLKSR